MWQSTREASRVMTVSSLPPSYSSLGAISKFLAAPIQKNSHIDGEAAAWGTGADGVILRALATVDEGERP